LETARLAVEGDLPRIAQLARVMHEELEPMKGGRLWAAREATPEPFEESYRRILEAPDACLVAGCIDDVVIGFAACRIETLSTGERLGVITDLFVEPDAREVGVGESLALALLSHCQSQGCSGIDARSLPGHRAAKNFFEEQGFTARAIVMHKPLSADT
jgi:ribosomal protein S18 acetylase RimI-like enzyme